MKLQLSSSTPWRSNYCTEDGRVVYKVDSPHTIMSSPHIRIYKVASNSLTTGGLFGGSILHAEFNLIGEVEWHSWRDTMIRYGDRDAPAGDWFTKKFTLGHPRPRVFVAGGREYVWKISHNSCKLLVNDKYDTPVATYHTKSHGVFSKSHPAYLEIFPAGQHMVDLIIVTFVYMEKFREERDKGGAAVYAATT